MGSSTSIRTSSASWRTHNDSTSVSVSGVYRDATGTPRGGKATPVITFGHSKDHRPDLKQLVWILTVAADGAVPIAYRLADGNTNDDPTHVPTWDGPPTATNPTSNDATTYSRPPRTPTPSCYTTPPGSRPCSAATSSPC
jgi:transposase